MKSRSLKTSLLVIVATVMMFTTSTFVMTGCARYDFTIGINQFLHHAALNQSREAFEEELTKLMNEAGKTVGFNVSNANRDNATATTISNNFIAQRVDLIFALGTASAQTARDAAKDTLTPVVYGAISNPTTAGLIGQDHVTGTSDRLDMKAQIELIRELVGGTVSTIAYIYTASEPNSVDTRNALVTAAAAITADTTNDYNITILTRPITDIADLPSVMTAIASSDAQAIFIGTDNTIAGNMEQLASLNRDGAKLPIVTGASQMAQEGGVASQGVNYTDIGIEAARMAFKILVDGIKPGDIPPMYFDENPEKMVLLLNRKVATDIGFTIPQAMIDRATTVINP